VTGSYIEEPVFGAVVRTALRLGYTLVPYEHSGRATDDEDGLTRQQRRDQGQARNLRDRIFQQNPDAKVLAHAGFGHVEEVVSPRFYPMAVCFTEMTGIDLVTVDQTTLSERSTPAHNVRRRPPRLDGARWPAYAYRGIGCGMRSAHMRRGSPRPRQGRRRGATGPRSGRPAVYRPAFLPPGFFYRPTAPSTLSRRPWIGPCWKHGPRSNFLVADPAT